jgi:hypothetical protein
MSNRIFILSIMAGIILIIMSCKDENKKNDCGCDSDNKTYVTDQTGILQKDSLGGDFYIYKREAGSINSSSIVCNADEVKNIALGSNVTYSGYRSALCDSSTFNTEQIFISVITISKIQINQ